jgi:phenylacetate-CoA ligase
MPLLRYDIADEVEVTYDACPCGWWLPVVTVFGRIGRQAAAISQVSLEEQVYRLPAEWGVLFWRARTTTSGFTVEIEVATRYRAEATRALRDRIRLAFGITADVVAVPPGGLVPARLLTADGDVMKPRGLFDAGEDWNKALEYY